MASDPNRRFLRPELTAPRQTLTRTFADEELMKSIAVVALSFLLLIPVAAHGQHSLGMHSHSGTGSVSACEHGRFDRLPPIKLYPPGQAGNLHHKVSTDKPLAQQYFDQGLTFFYGFDSESALRSFYQASKEDSKLAMAYWGVALAAGGDLNIPPDDPCMKLAVEQTKLANQHFDQATAPEQLYVKAISQRYPADFKPGSHDLQQLSVNYMLEMEAVYKEIGSKDPDAGALYAYSLMNLRPWLWWTTFGQPSAEITFALRVIEDSLRIPAFQSHIGLNHMLIHAMEEGPVVHAARAESAAELLDKKAPFITPHLRHMPAHTFLLLGLWDRVVAANQRAKDADQPWAEDCQNLSSPDCNQLLVGHYYSHDLLFLDVGYNNRGEWKEVEPLSDQLETNVRKFIDSQPGLEHYLTTKVAMMVHFGKWEELAALKPPQPDMPNPKDKNFCGYLKDKHAALATAMWYFGRGMANASLGRPTDDALFGFQQAQSCVQSAGIGWGNNSASAILQVVKWRLLERIARKKSLKDAAITFALLAVETEDLLDYDEPPGWYLSSRETYGAAVFLKGDLGSAGRAEDIFKADLRRHPNNSRSLFGVWQALAKQHPPESPEVKRAKELFEKQWKSRDPRDLPKLEDM